MRGKLGPDKITFSGPFAIKGQENKATELRLLQMLTPGAHAPGGSVMPIGKPVARNAITARVGLGRLKYGVWSFSALRKPHWKVKLIRHLGDIWPSRGLIERVRDLSDTDGTLIHGDATMSNLMMFDGYGVCWIDPMDRPYIPGSRDVDVGKMLQSAIGYEHALEFGILRKNEDVWNAAMTFASYPKDAETWLLVHCARLLRYHEPYVRRAFTEYLNDNQCGV